jgi:5-methylcytosine-specific restriction endonuclease McrBC regulatory subunit McrC
VSITVAAAPSGTRVGFTAAGGDAEQLLITVAPKAWRTDPRRVIALPHWPDQPHHHVTMYETDRLHVTDTSSGVNDLLKATLQVARSTSIEEGLWDSALLAPDIEPRSELLAHARSVNTDEVTRVAELLQLFDRLELLQPDTQKLRGIRTRSPLHRPLLYRRLLDELFTLVQSARRGYRPVTAARASVRGRLETSSLLKHALTGDPYLVCHYDELTESTLLLGIVCTGLEWIADGHGIRSPFGGRFAETSLRHDAVTLRRILAEVTTLSPPRALLVGPKLHLNRLDRPWETALRLTLSVLAESEHVPARARSMHTEPVELSIPTDKLWETIVHAVLIRSGFTRVLDQYSQPTGLVVDPWVTTTPAPPNTRPDNIAFIGDDVWIVDAKYKTPSAGAAPDRDDQYQMFAYSHLVADPRRHVRLVILAYPGNAPARRWRRGRDKEDARPVQLLAVPIPFPRPENVRTTLSWQNYLDESALRFTSAVAKLREN